MSSNKIMIAAGLVLAFVIGAMANGFYSVSTNAFNPADQQQQQVAPAVRTVRSTPAVARTRYVAAPATRTVTVDEPVARVVEQPKKRSWEREVLIVGGSAGAGAAIGAVAGGKKGAAIGALSGGVAGLVYDMATRRK